LQFHHRDHQQHRQRRLRHRQRKVVRHEGDGDEGQERRHVAQELDLEDQPGPEAETRPLRIQLHPAEDLLRQRPGFQHPGIGDRLRRDDEHCDTSLLPKLSAKRRRAKRPGGSVCADGVEQVEFV
jgi:hypothetical protein